MRPDFAQIVLPGTFSIDERLTKLGPLSRLRPCPAPCRKTPRRCGNGVLGRARCNVSLGRYRDADADVATLLSLAPDNPLMLLMAGMIHHRLGRSHRNARGLGQGRLSAGAGPHPRLRRRGTTRLGQAPTGDLQKRRYTNFRSVGHLDPPTVKPPRQLRTCLAKTREPPA